MTRKLHIFLVGLFFLFSSLQTSHATAFDSKMTTETVFQKRVITGQITGENNTPLAQAAIKVQGMSIGVYSDFDGNYSLVIPEDATTLVVSYTGYKDQVVAIDNKTVINVQLAIESPLDEVVVVGFGRKKKINLSGAVSQVEGKYFESRPVTDVGSALQGAISNLNVFVSSGQPGAVPTFNIRGVTSLSGGGPLIVIDGVPATSSDLTQLNPADIASVSALKDAASAAIYGSRASFGVILVTTKKASSKTLTVNARMNNSYRYVTKLPDIVRDPYTVARFRDILASPLYDLYSDEDLEYAQKVSLDPSTPSVRLNPNDNNAWQYFSSTNWFDEVYNNQAATQNYSVDISKSLDKGSYFFSIESYRQKGMLRYNNDVYKRLNLRLNVDFKIRDWLTIGNNTWFNNNTNDQPLAVAGGGAGFFNTVNRQPALTPLFNPDGTNTGAYARTIGALNSGNSNSEKKNIFTQFKTTINLYKDLWKLEANAAFRRNNTSTDSYSVPVKIYNGPNDIQQTSNNSWANVYDLNQAQNNYTVLTSFTETFNKKHYLNVLLGYNQEEFSSNSRSTRRNDLISAALPTINLATGDVTASQSQYSWATQGYFYRFNYIFDKKYIIEFDGRYDGSSRFPKKNRWAFNPSASGAWVVSNENFFKPLQHVVSLLKLRASYGSLGNQNVRRGGTPLYYPYIPALGTSRTTSIIDGERQTTVTSPGLVSPELTWETVKIVNYGVDLALFNNRFNASFDLYRRYTENMLTKGAELPSVLGTNEPLENAADLVTKGWDLQVSWKDQFNLSKKPFLYNINFNLSDSRSFIEKYDNPVGALNDYYVGREIGEIWGLTTLGYFQSNDEVTNSPDQSAVASRLSQRPITEGDVKFADLNGDDAINRGDWTLENHGDYKVIGNSRSRYIFGLDLNASWSGFDLRAFFQGVGKKDWYPGPGVHYFWGSYAQPWASLTRSNLDHWTPENRDAFLPKPKSYVAERSRELGIPQTRYLQNAAYIRMKNITLGYTIPSAVTERVNMKKIRIYASGENLFEFTDLYSSLDPEILGRTNAYPFQKTYSLGLSVSF